jgi:hypothetical protein
MAEADIAYVATAGAAGLAMAVSAWALLLRGRLHETAVAAERERVEALADLSRHDAMLRAFDDVSLALTPDGQAAGLPIGSAELIARLSGEDAEAGAAVLNKLRITHGALIDALVHEGQASSKVWSRWTMWSHGGSRAGLRAVPPGCGCRPPRASP